MSKEMKSCFDCCYCKKLYVVVPVYHGYGWGYSYQKSFAAIECTRNGSRPLIWNHQCSFHKPKEEA